jgi:hypothetical protein
MAASNPFIEQALIQQDLEKIRFSENLRKNASDYSQFVNDRVNQMTDEAFNRKRTAFQKAHIDLGRYMDMDHNASHYKIRNADINRLNERIEINNQRIANNVYMDRDITKRQYEINEYFYHNKLETLFFMQVFFISMLATAVIMYGQKTGIITAKIAGLLTGILVVIVLVVGVSRYFYTARTRDRTHWHKRYFPKEGAPPPATNSCKGGPMEIDINSLIPKSITACGDEMAGRVDMLKNALQSELHSYQQTGKVTPIAKPGTCSQASWNA